MSGIVRRMDQLNRITLPSEFIQIGKYEQKQEIEICFNGYEFTIYKFNKEDILKSGEQCGSFRKLDELNRVTFPKDWIDFLRLKKRDKLEIEYNNEVFTIRKWEED